MAQKSAPARRALPLRPALLLTELTDANFADTVGELRNCNTTLESPQSTDPPTLHPR